MGATLDVLRRPFGRSTAYCKVKIVQVSELSGAALDYWVARALASDAQGAYTNSLGEACIINNECVLPPKYRAFRPSSDWATGGAVIEDRRISIHATGEVWEAFAGTAGKQTGESALQAAMRAYVAAKFGEVLS